MIYVSKIPTGSVIFLDSKRKLQILTRILHYFIFLIFFSVAIYHSKALQILFNFQKVLFLQQELILEPSDKRSCTRTGYLQ